MGRRLSVTDRATNSPQFKRAPWDREEGAKLGFAATHTCMDDSVSTDVDELVTQLLEWGGLVSHIISHMVAFAESGRSSPDAAPIPEVAHELFTSVLTDLRRRHSRRDITVAARIVREATDAVGENIFFVPDEVIDRANPEMN